MNPFKLPSVKRLYGNSRVPLPFDVNDEPPIDYKEHYRMCERERIAFEQRQRDAYLQCQCPDCKQERKEK